MRARTVTLALLLICTAASTQAFNGLDIQPQFPEPFGYGGNFVRLGWYDKTQAWFYCVATNDIDYTRQPLFFPRLTLVPKLSSALTPRVLGGDIAARPVYFVTNNQNPPVFSAFPGQPLYSALWQVFNVTWKPGVPRRPITSAEPASPANPTGVPGPAEADVVATGVVLDCPILASGPLTNPFVRGPGHYLIEQAGTFVNSYSKIVFLPAWFIYCQDPVTKRVDTALAQITDVSDPALATLLGANLAPGLLNMPDEDTTAFYVMRGPKPLQQFPLVADCPRFVGGFNNSNYLYSPVMRYTILRRNLPGTTLVKSMDYLRFLLGTGGLQILREDQRINAPVIISG